MQDPLPIQPLSRPVDATVRIPGSKSYTNRALIIAAINLLRPSLLLFGLALATACFGVVLYNVNLSALAVGLLVLSLARRAPEPD